jgi:hypothetical protein
VARCYGGTRFTDGRPEMAFVNEVSPGNLTSQRVVRSFAFGRKPTRDPLRLSGNEVVDVFESERLELPRSSRAHVSEVIPAIHDGRSGLIEPCCSIPVERFERDVDRSRKMLLLVFAFGEHLDKLDVISLEQGAKLSDVDLFGHSRLGHCLRAASVAVTARAATARTASIGHRTPPGPRHSISKTSS